MAERSTGAAAYEELCRTFRIDVPKSYNFGFDVIDAWADKDRNKLAMIWVNQDGTEKKYSFRDLKNLSNQAANILIKYGVQKGDRVLIMLPRIPEWWIFVIALIKLGAVLCPCPTMLTPKDIKYRLNAGTFRMIITNLENSAKVEEVVTECSTLTCRFLVDGERPGWVKLPQGAGLSCPGVIPFGQYADWKKTLATDPMLIYFTSGTTGEPKMVLHNHSYPLGHLVTATLWQDVGENDVHFTSSDTGWAKCAWGKIFGQWIAGACIFVYDVRGKFKATELLPLLEKYEITTFCVPPTIYRMLILADLEKFDLRELRRCTSAGEPLNPEVVRVWMEGTGRTISEGYGQTETVCCIGTFRGMETRPGSMGRPAPGWHIELHDDEGRPVEQGEEGRIAISIDPRPVGLFVEYVNSPEANAASFVNGFYYTGDKATIDADGYFWFVGRNDDIIKSPGYRIGPFEVESALLEHPAVQESAVVGSPDLIRGVIVKAFIVLKPGYQPSETLIRDIQSHVRNSTAPYKYPRAVEFVPDLPKTLSGKIRRNELRQRELEKYRSRE